MKYLNKILGILLMAFVLSSCASMNMQAQSNEQYVSDQEFYDQLSPYGTWVDDPRYGNVWVPDVDGDFRPYATNGHWVLTEYGNTWVSDYEWGWAAFHYGRWNFDDYYGWEWVPGNEWAPAWVTWKGGDGYYGWAPMSPEINYDASFADDYNYNIPDNYWVFTSQAYINQPDIYNYYVPYSIVPNIIRRTSYVRNVYNFNNRRYYTGPRRDEIQRYSRSPVNVYNIRNVNRPGISRVNNNTVNFYRPDIRRSANARPTRVVDAAAYRQQNPNQRIGGIDRRSGTTYNRDNAARLANTARNGSAGNVVRVNPPARVGVMNPANRPIANPNVGNPNRPTNTDRNNNRRPAVTGTPEQQQQIQQTRDAQRQQRQQQQQQRPQQQPVQGQQPGVNNDQQQQLNEQQRQQQQIREQQRQQRQQQGQQPGVTDEQRRQQQQIREQQRQQRQQERQQQQQQGQQPGINDAQRQQQQQAREQQRQQFEQQRQQQQQARQQQQQAREQQRQQQTQQQQQQRQQADQQRQQQQQQAREQQRQQADQQRQQQQQAREQQRQQADQQRQQQEQQRQQQKQQQEQQRQQQQPVRERPDPRPGRP